LLVTLLHKHASNTLWHVETPVSTKSVFEHHQNKTFTIQYIIRRKLSPKHNATV